MIKIRSGLVFPLALALILGGLTAWLGRISNINIEETKLPANEPQYQMQNLSGQRFDKQGKLQESLTAQRAWQLPEQKEVHFATPKLQIYRSGILQYNVTANRADYHTTSRQVNFNQGVILHKPATTSQPEGEITTDYLTVDTANETAHTDANINYRYGRSYGSAKGMNYDNKNGKLDLPAQVKAIIYDLKKP